MTVPAHESRHVLRMRVDAVSYASAERAVFDRIASGTPGYVCVANVHMVMETHDDPSFREDVNAGFLVVPDGMPLVWALRLLGVGGPSRVRGADLTLALVRRAADLGVSVGLYGGHEEVVSACAATLRRRAPGVDIVAIVAPPFRPLSVDEQATYARGLREAGVRLLFVGLGCPKQERWMASHASAVGGVAVGVGAAFDFFAGSVREAPRWMQAVGLEWLFRLVMEPKRLIGRYARHNPRFVLRFAAQWVRHLSFGGRRRP